MNLDTALGLTTVLLVATTPPLLHAALSTPPAHLEQAAVHAADKPVLVTGGPVAIAPAPVVAEPAAPAAQGKVLAAPLAPAAQGEILAAPAAPTHVAAQVPPQHTPTPGIVDATTPPPAPALTGKVVPETPPALRLPILVAAQTFGIPSDVLSAALARESANFNPKYVYGWHVDGTGRGIAGIDKKYHGEVSDEQAFDPIFSINWEARMLATLVKKNKGDLYSALREYNGGENFDSDRPGYLGRPVSQLTRAHADAIMSHAASAVPVSARG